ncbi:52 kDa repressor of the inhibitor of the protein kinase-like [Aphis craccivora]|uniref:52 kDa repressor of the inhibitor of the protein kinase-like n=1 Tax=Aphis craccivora TaxID=307492 RepID=A0A6G0YII4_APHCR|nr:52 kDa repressor of the inhibitor of the protein kinase-like [Aphis craccivora]
MYWIHYRRILAHKLKSLCETRWVLRHEAIMIFKELLQPIISALEQIENDSKNKESIKRAHILLKIYLINTFESVSEVSKKLQNIRENSNV